MTQTDTNLVSEAAKIYKVLSNSRRISILFFLRNASKEVDVSTIATTLTLAQPVVSKQLGILEKYNLVKHHKHG
ncbi:MAG: ArsR family transcriptional regulator, partial [Lactobacillus johnsonii]|nr:ArsR family transcriptional regulator [Lactobacillus johnsonii]